METSQFGTCPGCGQPMERGFAVRKAALSWVAPGQLQQFVFLDKDLHEAGLRRHLPGKAEYDRAFHCPACRVYLVDYSRAFSRAEAEELARAM